MKKKNVTLKGSW